MALFYSHRPFIFVMIIVLLNLGCSDEADRATNGGLVDITDSVRLNFIHDSGAEGKYWMPEVNGPGSAFFDYDNDGDQDVYFINGRSRSKQSKNRLFRQEANGSFTDVTDESGLGDKGFGMGVAIGDINNDNYLDVYITNYDRDALYQNQTDGTFKNITERAGVKNQSWASSVVFFDYDLDGFLDIYVTNYVELDTNVTCRDMSGRPDYCAPASHPAASDVLYRNNGDDSFTDVSNTTRIDFPKRPGLGVVSSDFNDDGYPDVYVANDGEENTLWINNKNGTFSDASFRYGVAVNRLGKTEASMGIALGDVSGDGRQDIYLTHLVGESNTLYLNMGSMGFEDVSNSAGFESNEFLSYTGFGVGLVDLNLDGNLELIIGNGKVSRSKQAGIDENSYWAPYCEPNLIFIRTGDAGFRNASSLFGAFASPLETTRGLAFADYDNDGDIDILVNNCGGQARLYRNEIERKGNWLSLSLVDPKLRREPIGTKVTVICKMREFYREVNPGYSYLCSNDYRIHVGLGLIDQIQEINVDWPGEGEERFTGISVNQHIILIKGEGVAL